MVDPVHDRVADGAVMRRVGIQSLIPIGIRIILRTEYCCAVFGSSFNDLEGGLLFRDAGLIFACKRPYLDEIYTH